VQDDNFREYRPGKANGSQSSVQNTELRAGSSLERR
jgi:hypothetical protein